MKRKVFFTVFGLAMLLTTGCTTYYEGYGYTHTHWVPVYEPVYVYPGPYFYCH